MAHVSGANFLNFMALLNASLTDMPGFVGTKVCPCTPKCARMMVRTGDLGAVDDNELELPPAGCRFVAVVVDDVVAVALLDDDEMTCKFVVDEDAVE